MYLIELVKKHSKSISEESDEMSIEAIKELYEYKILSENSFEKLVEMMNELSDLYEDKKIFLVEEEKFENIIIRDFATIDNGYRSSLIICPNVIKNIVKKL
jgi:methanogenic corrinoid protein MtbC1